jgi:hypothetical protein
MTPWSPETAGGLTHLGWPWAEAGGSLPIARPWKRRRPISSPTMRPCFAGKTRRAWPGRDDSALRFGNHRVSMKACRHLRLSGGETLDWWCCRLSRYKCGGGGACIRPPSTAKTAFEGLAHFGYLEQARSTATWFTTWLCSRLGLLPRPGDGRPSLDAGHVIFQPAIQPRGESLGLKRRMFFQGPPGTVGEVVPGTWGTPLRLQTREMR